MARIIDKLSQGDGPEPNESWIVSGDEFRIEADKDNPIEAHIIRVLRDEPLFIQALNYAYSNVKHHSGETLGKHISRVLNYIERQAKEYKDWKRQREKLRIIAWGHDLAYPDVKNDREIPSIEHGEFSEIMLAA